MRKRFLIAATLLCLGGPSHLTVAQTSDEAPGRQHFFPLIAAGDGLQTHLFVTDASGASNQCSLTMGGSGLNVEVFAANDAVSPAGAGANIDLAAGGDVVLQSLDRPALVYGHAKLECEQPTTARVMLTSHIGGELMAMTAFENASPGTSFQFPALPGLGRLAVILSSDAELDAVCAVELEGEAGPVGGGEIAVPAHATTWRNLDELIPIPEDFQAGTAGLACSRNVSATGLALFGAGFAALPAIEFNDADARHVQILPLVLDGEGFRSHLLLNNISETVNPCTVDLRGAGLGGSRFSAPAGATTGDSSIALELDSGRAQVLLGSTGAGTLAFGHATVYCEGPVAVQNLLTAEVEGNTAAMASISRADSAVALRFPVVSELGRLALVMSNAGESDTSCGVELSGDGDFSPETARVEISGESTAVRFLDDLFAVPDDFAGGSASLHCDSGIAAMALPVQGAVFAAMRPAILVSRVASEPVWIFADDVPDDLRLELREELEAVRDWFTEQYGVTASGFEVHVREGGCPGSPIGTCVTRTDDGSAIIVLNPESSPGNAIAEEYFHVLQGQLSSGFAPLPNGKIVSHSWKGAAWLVEGLAQYADYKYSPHRPGRRPFLVDSNNTNNGRNTPYRDLSDAISRGILTAADLSKLEDPGNLYGGLAHPLYTYALAFVASTLLAELAGEEDSYVRYWRLLNERATWQEAFQAAFGVAVEDFYDEFEQWLPTVLPLRAYMNISYDWPGRDALDDDSRNRLINSLGLDLEDIPLEIEGVGWSVERIVYPGGQSWTAHLGLWWEDPDNCTEYFLGWHKDGGLTERKEDATPVEFPGVDATLNWELPSQPDMLPRLSERSLPNCTP